MRPGSAPRARSSATAARVSPTGLICANRVPDHATGARFVARHERALAELFGSVLDLCAKAGLVSTGVVAIDGTKLAANASREANLDYERIAREIVAEARATDEAEDGLYGEARGDELPEQLRTSAGRRKWLREAKRDLEAERVAAEEPVEELRRCRAAGRSTRAAGAGSVTLAAPRRAPGARVAADPTLARGAAFRVQAPPRGGASGRARRERGLRGLPRSRDLARRAPLRRWAAESPPGARDPDGQDQHDRPPLAAVEGGPASATCRAITRRRR
jgi:hypothetical protein